MFKKPDFVCVGQMKAATGWLSDQLTSHTEVWIPPIKELHVLNAKWKRRYVTEWASRFLDPYGYYEDPHAEHPFDLPWSDQLEMGVDVEKLKYDFDFYRKALLDPGDKRLAEKSKKKRAGQIVELDTKDFAWYSDLFPETSKIVGELTPDYASLPYSEIEIIQDKFPDTKYILIIRDPVSRSISHLNHYIRNKGMRHEFDPSDLDIQSLKMLVAERPNIMQKSSISHLEQSWCRLPAHKIRVIFFEDIINSPELVRNSVAEFLNISVDGFRLPASLNRKESYKKIEISDLFKDYLAHALSYEITRYKHLRDIYPGKLV